jgi:hypothetical protein
MCGNYWGILVTLHSYVGCVVSHDRRLKYYFKINTKHFTDADQKRITGKLCLSRTVSQFIKRTSALPGSHSVKYGIRSGSLREEHTSADNVLFPLEGMLPFGPCIHQITNTGKLGFQLHHRRILPKSRRRSSRESG